MASKTSIYDTPESFQKAYARLITLMMIVAAIFAIIYLYTSPGNILVRFVLAVIALMVSGEIIASANGIEQHSLGAYMLGGKRGIGVIEWLAKQSPRIWLAFADWGIGFSFGILSYFVFKKNINKKAMLAGIITIIVVLFVAFPYLPVILNFINIPQITSKIGTTEVASSPSSFSLFFYIFVAASVIGGFSLGTIILILFSGGSILYTTSVFLVSLLSSHPNTGVLNQQVPGVAPLIPGITIPLVAGIISLIILLVVHEFSHGVLAKIAKIRIRSIGVILFGIIPLGAYVEPDEREVRKLKAYAQDRISIAGISANMVTSIFFFIITFIIISYVLPNVSTGGVLITEVIKNYSAYGVIPVNSTILAWNNVTIRNVYDLEKVEASYVSGPVNIVTNQGSFTVTPNSQGKIGILAEPAQTGTQYQLTNFIYSIAALSFGLNFFVAIFNLLPIPAFDGWRIYENRVKNKALLKAFSAIIIVAILLNALPWLWSV